MARLAPFKQDLPLAEAVRLVLLEQLATMRQAAASAASEDEEESVSGLHDFRVTIRRSLAVLDSCSGWLNRDWLKAYRRGFRSWLKQTGYLRDLDVLDQSIMLEQEYGQAVPPACLEKLQNQRRKLRRKITPRLEGKPFLKWMSGKAAALNREDVSLKMALPVSGKRGQIQMAVIKDCLPVLLYQEVARLMAYHQALPALPSLPREQNPDQDESLAWADYSDEILHRLRLSGKQLRYSFEFAMRISGMPIQPVVDSLKDLQDALGHWHDAVFASEWGWKLAKDQPEDPVLMAWLSRKQAEKMAAREDFDRLWPHLDAGGVYPQIQTALSSLYPDRKDASGQVD